MPSADKLRAFAHRPAGWVVFLALGAAAMAVHAALPTGELTQSLLYDVVGLVAVAAILAGVFIHKPAMRWPWLLLALGQFSFVVGDLLWLYYEQVGETPFPSLADAFYLGGYPFIAVALAGFISRRIGGGDRAGLLDAAILTTGVAVVSWTTLVAPGLVDSELTPLELGISLAYPLADLILIGVAMGILTTPGARTGAFGLLVGSLVILFGADQLYALANLNEAYVSGSPLDLGYLAAYLLTGATALHPSMRTLSEPRPIPITWLGPVRLVFLTVAMLSGPLALGLASGEFSADLWVVAGATALLSLLVLARLALLVRTLAGDVATRKVLEERLSYQAFHDSLTDLANRRRFVERARSVLDARTRTGQTAALFIDLDDFKTVNDSLGHAAGDALLVAVAARIRQAVRSNDTAARLGGDEFGVLLEGVDDLGTATAVADRILELMDEPISIGGNTMTVHASIGIALDDHEADVDKLLREADVAMYQAKALGKGRHQVFAPSMHAELVERLTLKTDLQVAIETGALELDYQPIIQLIGGRVTGIEALVRWPHPTRGRLAPSAFIPMAEETGLIVPLGQWVLERACADLAELRLGMPQTDLAVSVNVAPRQFSDPSLPGTVRHALEAARLDPSSLIVELTESVVATEDTWTADALVHLRAIGVRVAIDDFGTGYSSLGTLQRFPVDILKIDRSFVTRLAADSDDAIARLIVTMGRTLGLATVAEGVETDAQASRLRDLGCDAGQGFLWARPMSLAALEAWLVEWPGLASELLPSAVVRHQQSGAPRRKGDLGLQPAG
jgi:diguanylate cyclase (GGDEF)-like protein